MTKINKTEEQWRKELTPEQFRILREKGTERAGTGAYNDFKGDGVFKCAGCGAVLMPRYMLPRQAISWARTVASVLPSPGVV